MAAAAVVVPLGLLRSRPFQCWFNAFQLHPRDDRQVKLRVSLIPKVLQRIKEGKHTFLLVATRWPARRWFSDLLQLLQGQPWQLPSRADLLAQAGGQIWHPNPVALRLWVWPVQSPSLSV